MKKILVILLTVFMLTACTSKTEESIQEEVTPEVQEVVEENKEDVIVGGWLINTSLPEMNDAVFDNARQNIDGASYSPLFVLGNQESGNNIKYLCYVKAVIPNAKPELKTVTVHKDDDNPIKGEIESVEEFNILNYLQGEGANTPEGLMGGWQDNSEFPNMLSDEENEIFNKALEGVVGVSYTPVAKLASQVVAGTNYAFLATGTKVTATPITHLYVVKIYADLSGNAEVTNICGIDLSEVLK